MPVGNGALHGNDPRPFRKRKIQARRLFGGHRFAVGHPGEAHFPRKRFVRNIRYSAGKYRFPGNLLQSSDSRERVAGAGKILSLRIHDRLIAVRTVLFQFQDLFCRKQQFCLRRRDHIALRIRLCNEEDRFLIHLIRLPEILHQIVQNSDLPGCIAVISGGIIRMLRNASRHSARQTCRAQYRCQHSRKKPDPFHIFLFSEQKRGYCPRFIQLSPVLFICPLSYDGSAQTLQRPRSRSIRRHRTEYRSKDRCRRHRAPARH